MKSYLELQQRRQGFVIIILFHKFKFLILHRKLVNETIMMNKHLGNWELWIAVAVLTA